MSAAPTTATAAAVNIAISPVKGIKPPVKMLGGVPVGVLMSDASRLPVDPSALSARRGDSAVMVSLGLAAATWSTSRPSALTVTERVPSKAV